MTTIRDEMVISPLKNQCSAVDSGSFAENEMKNVFIQAKLAFKVLLHLNIIGGIYDLGISPSLIFTVHNRNLGININGKKLYSCVFDETTVTCALISRTNIGS